MNPPGSKPRQTSGCLTSGCPGAGGLALQCPRPVPTAGLSPHTRQTGQEAPRATSLADPHPVSFRAQQGHHPEARIRRTGRARHLRQRGGSLLTRRAALAAALAAAGLCLSVPSAQGPSAKASAQQHLQGLQQKRKRASGLEGKGTTRGRWGGRGATTSHCSSWSPRTAPRSQKRALGLPAQALGRGPATSVSPASTALAVHPEPAPHL